LEPTRPYRDVPFFANNSEKNYEVLLHRLLPDGPQVIHDSVLGIQEIPVRSGRPICGSLQDADNLGLVKSGRVMQPERHHIEAGAQRRAALKQPSRASDWHDEAVLGQDVGGQAVLNYGAGHRAG
jgi:hypothetical protein